jgi:hypothetical protein
MTLQQLFEEVEHLPATEKRRLVRHLLDNLEEEKKDPSIGRLGELRRPYVWRIGG